MDATAHGRARPRVLLALAAVVAASAFWLVVPSANAAIGDINGTSCISKTGTDGCSLLPQPDALRSPGSLVVAPDGTDVYVGAAMGVAHFRRAANGDLTYANCVDVSSSIGDACPTSAPPDATAALSDNAILLAISPDGRFVYAVSWVDSLLWWSRDTTTGDLTWGGCKDAATDAATNGHCGTATTFGGGNFPAGSMAFSQGISITPDGGTLYIADQQEGLLQAQLNTSTGAPTPTACFNTTGSAATGCTSLAADIPMAASGLDLGSNSRDVYLRSISPGGITHFQRSPGGTTTFFSCIANASTTANCLTFAPSPVFSYSGAIGVSGNDLFSHVGNYGTPSGTVAKLSRAVNGSLTFVNCASTEAAPGPCATLPTGTLGGNIGKLPISADGTSIYTRQSGTSSALSRLTGSLTFASCLAVGVAACSSPTLPVPFVVSTGTGALSPDGRQLYQPASHQINTFSIEGPPTDMPGTPDTTGPPVAPKPVIRSVVKLRKGRRRGQYRVKIRVFQAGSIAARFRGRLRRGAKVRSLSKTAKRNATGPATYTLYFKPSAAARKRKVRATLHVAFTSIGYQGSSARKSVRLR
ncbi:MAG: hypothetical protein HZB14_04890 [Actinobacteria bacterium]|nr:hypothetical protein [Actinomycetota bacterium]